MFFIKDCQYFIGNVSTLFLNHPVHIPNYIYNEEQFVKRNDLLLEISVILAGYHMCYDLLIWGRDGQRKWAVPSERQRHAYFGFGDP